MLTIVMIKSKLQSQISHLIAFLSSGRHPHLCEASKWIIMVLQESMKISHQSQTKVSWLTQLWAKRSNLCQWAIGLLQESLSHPSFICTKERHRAMRENRIRLIYKLPRITHRCINMKTTTTPISRCSSNTVLMIESSSQNFGTSINKQRLKTTRQPISSLINPRLMHMNLGHKLGSLQFSSRTWRPTY